VSTIDKHPMLEMAASSAAERLCCACRYWPREKGTMWDRGQN